MVFTTGQIGKICGVAPRTATKWFDSGLLVGYRLPSCGRPGTRGDRRVTAAELYKFLQKHGMTHVRIPGYTPPLEKAG